MISTKIRIDKEFLLSETIYYLRILITQIILGKKFYLAKKEKEAITFNSIL